MILGHLEFTIAALLGHSAAGVTARYVHHVDAALVASADRIVFTIALRSL